MKYCIIATVAIISVALAQTTCRWVSSGTDPENPMSATFDLSPLAGIDYRVVDHLSYIESRNLSYVFQICGTVNTIPTPGGTTIPCYGEEGEAVHYPAYQVSNTGDLCRRLGLDATSDNVRWSLVDSSDPTVGVVYSYINGDDRDGCPSPRSLVIELDCMDDEYNLPDEELVIENSCEYRLTFNSIYGCPTECGVYRGLCAKRGKCKFDKDTGKPHCYCQQGWTGFACNERGENSAEGFTNTTLIMIVVLVLLILVELGIILMWNKVKRLRLDPSAYANFAAADELA